MPSSFDFSQLFQSSSFEPNAILRGAQLTLVGANRALQNPALFTSDHYRQAAVAVLAGILIRLLVAIPSFGIQLLIRFICLLTDCTGSTWAEDVADGIHHFENEVLQLPFFLMSLMRHLSPTMDDMFMTSLAWVDQTYVQKHKSEDPTTLRDMYYPNLRSYDEAHLEKPKEDRRKKDRSAAMKAFLMRMGRKAALSLIVYLASFLPVVGRFVLPAASFFTTNRALGTMPAILIFSSSLFLPRRYLVMFLQSFFSSRSMMRELLEPYFSRVPYSKSQKQAWFRSRQSVLYGFALAFFVLVKIPLVGVLVYGIAEASTAYLITKITAPPPPPSEVRTFIEQDVTWENQHEFLSLPLEAIDRFNSERKKAVANNSPKATEIRGRQFT